MIGRTSRLDASGFTLIELMVCLTIIGIMLTLVTPRYFHTIGSVEESVLRQNLLTTRDAIDKYFSDRGRYPDRLEDLVKHRYLRAVPYDPVTHRSDTWVLIAPSPPFLGKIYDLRSGSHGKANNGTPAAEL